MSQALLDLLGRARRDLIKELFDYDPRSDSYRIKPGWQHFGAEQLRRLEKRL